MNLFMNDKSSLYYGPRVDICLNTSITVYNLYIHAIIYICCEWKGVFRNKIQQMYETRYRNIATL